MAPRAVLTVEKTVEKTEGETVAAKAAPRAVLWAA